MLQNIDWWKRISHRVFPLLPPLTAAAIVAFQQIYCPNAQVSTIINIVFLALNLLEFLPVVQSQPIKGIIKYVVGTFFIMVFAFIYNVCIVGVPSPLSAFPAFLNSICGMWALISVLELTVFVCVVFYHGRPIKSVGSGGATGVIPSVSAQTENSSSGRQPVVGGQASDFNGMPPQPNATGTPDGNRYHYCKPKLVFVAFFLCAIILPLIPWRSATRWMQSVREITASVFGNEIKNQDALVVIITYIFLIFVGMATLYILYEMAVYLITRHRGQGSEQTFFEEYATPITLLIVVGTGVLAVGKVNFDNGFNGIDLIAKLFTWLLSIVIGIITLFVLFESTRQVLKQCTEKGSLLKTSMHLVFVIITEYTMGLLTGILRIFAVRGIIEDLLLFFMPGLEDSIGPKVNNVLKKALDDEVEEISETSKVKHKPPKKSKHRQGFRTIYGRRHK